MSTVDIIRNYILENYLFTSDQSALANDTSFLKSGIIDSTGILEVISFLESEFGITVEDEEMIPENLDSVDNLVAFVARKKRAA
jgi:Acyl carrier protein